MVKKIKAYSPKNEAIEPMLNLEGVMLITSSGKCCPSVFKSVLSFEDMLVSLQVKTCMAKYTGDCSPLYIPWTLFLRLHLLTQP